MNTELTEEQSNLIKELKLIDPDHPFKGIPDFSSQSNLPEEGSSNKHSSMSMFFDVSYDHEHEQLREKLMSYRKKS